MSSVLPFAKLSIDFDHIGMVEQLEKLLKLDWIEHVNTANYQGGWDVFPLRCLKENVDKHPILQSFAIETGDDWENLPNLEQSPALVQLINKLQCPVKAVRLMRLKAGAHIKPHRDHGLAIEQGEARLHITVSGGEGVTFKIQDQIVPMNTGGLWYINADMTHEVTNIGANDRINLVIDCLANDWLKERVNDT